jgi:translation initiation factor IF-1
VFVIDENAVEIEEGCGKHRGRPRACIGGRLVSASAGLKPPNLSGTSFEPHMSKGDLLEMEGVIQDALGGGQYTIKVDQGGAIVRAQLSGRMRRHHIRVLPGDRVRVAVSPYDLTHGLIVYRGK